MLKNAIISNLFNLAITEYLILFSLFAIIFIPLILCLATIKNILLKVSNQNRNIQPNSVWLVLIPIFGLVWQFKIVNNVSESLNKEFSKREIIINEKKPGYEIGIYYCIMTCCIFIPTIGRYAFWLSIILLLVFWRKMSRFNNMLSN